MSWTTREESHGEFFTWKILGVSSIPHAVGYVVHSPPFSFAGTYWTIKMYPNGDTEQNEGHISVIIERSDAQGQGECRFYYKDINNLIYLDCATLYNSQTKASISRLIWNRMKDFHDSKVVINDSFYLVLQLKSFCGCSDPKKSSAECIGTIDGNENVMGKILKENDGWKHISYIVSDIPDGLPVNYLVESPRFSFLNSSWILKLWPYYRMQNSQNRKVEIVLERLESEVLVHDVEIKINLNKSIKKTMFFDSSHTRSSAFSFALDKPDETSLHFSFDIEACRTTRVFLELQKKFAENAPDYLLQYLFIDDKDGRPRRLNELPEKIKHFYSKKELCDVTLDVKGTEFKAHRLILADRSPFFAFMFKDKMVEKQSLYMYVYDFDPEPFKFFLDYLYEGKVESVSFQNAVHLYKIADYYSVPDLKRLALEQIKHNLKVENILDSVILAEEYDEKELYAASQDFFNRNLKDIFETAQWKTFLENNFSLANKLLIQMTSSITINEKSCKCK